MLENNPLATIALPATRPEQSPWNELEAAQAAAVPVHWRTEEHFVRDYQEHDERHNSVTVYVYAIGGTVLAGALFPAVVAFVALLMSKGPLPDLASLPLVALYILMGGVVGAIIAAIAACAVFPMFGFVQWMARLHPWSVLLASCAGGWSGFASVVGLTHHQLAQRHDILMGMVFAGSAMLMGQIGAGWAASRARRLTRNPASSNESPRHRQIPLRQLFGITTAVAVVAVVVRALPLSSVALAMVVAAASAQAAVVAAYFAARAGIRRAT